MKYANFLPLALLDPAVEQMLIRQIGISVMYT